MKKYLPVQLAGIVGLLLWLCPTPAAGQYMLRIHRNDGVVMMTPLTPGDSLSLNDDHTRLYVHFGESLGEVELAAVDSLTFGEAEQEVRVTYSEEGTTAVNPYAFRGVDLQIAEGGAVTVSATTDAELTYRLRGAGTGSFKLYSGKKQQIILDGLQLTSADGPALNIQSKKKTTLSLPAGTSSSLCDATTYTACGTEDAKGCVFSEGQIVLTGQGSLTLRSVYKHALCSDDYISMEGGCLTIEGAAGDGIHAKDYFAISDGTLTCTTTAADAIDSEGCLYLRGGQLELAATTADTKAAKCDSLMEVTGGTLHITLTGNTTKGLKSKGNMTLSGGQLTFDCGGGVAVTDGDPSYCTAIKCDSLLTIGGGTIVISHSGEAGKGLSADGDLLIQGGSITATMTGAGGSYTNASGSQDTYNATAIKADGQMRIESGSLDLSCSGSGGKCLASDGAMTIGTEAGGPTIEAVTSGSKISASGSSGTTTGGTTGPGGWGGGGGPGGNRPGTGTSSTGGNPKAIRCEGNLTVKGGDITVSTAQDGGEGLESKQTLTIDGGTIVANTYDDALNAATALMVNGGSVYAYASGNDGIDSNGTLTINGGIVVSSGTTAPEEGFDCDQNTFSINGGILVGMGGSTSTPTSSSCSQYSAVYSGSSASAGTVYTLCTAAGEHVLSIAVPRTYSSMTMLLSSPLLTAGGSYAIKTGCSLTGGTDFHGLVTGGSASGGTEKTSFTASSVVTTVR